MPAHKGSAHHKAVLDDDAVREARKEFRTGHATPAELAARYGITPGAMRRALNGRTWQHLADTEVPDAA